MNSQVGRRLSRRRIAPLLLGILTSVLIAQTALADLEWSHKRKVGPHELIDSTSAASVRCSYTTKSEIDYGDTTLWKGKLTRLDVSPPKLRSNMGEQMVGWRFIVQREKNASSTYDSGWITTYRSATQRAKATETTEARFTPMFVPVSVPRGNYSYRVLITMHWYKPDGTSEGSATHLLSYYETFFKDHVEKTAPPWCDGRTSYWL